MPPSSRSLGSLERSVMDVLWRATSALTVREVQERLEAGGSADLAYTTVMTVLDRLGAKEMVSRERDGRAFRYTAALSREAATAELLNATLDSSGDRTAALVHFARTVDPAEAAALRAALEEIEAPGTP
ncbi:MULTISPECIES: BlaI/MecI/CopY family transcriptional regulator [unclassified Aeromicrobium]|uniref:BlaI/MecI/CopY family transcriptional regulator n=1 Tax=unclassified Aeromicrobium TaxID=2633570 RepID=UPI002097F6D2|nr:MULTISPECIES: BlaI/MecI/CopY family transcriptional regulator [unclassified Aeromicrobium]MCO7240925.1 BlaI/MecI/CopY family transcriptional regulator [Aeromicrobium sp. CnD17-E]MDR6119861.1 putative transcriptional regulator [Aeromicrobium sp. SORGH_AS_0981]